jgi:hypothetical protein
MAQTSKPLRKAKEAGAAAIRVATKLDNVKRAGAPAPSDATVARYKKQKAKDTATMVSKGTVPQREAKGEKNVREKFNAKTTGMVQQGAKNNETLKKRTYVGKAFTAKK